MLSYLFFVNAWVNPCDVMANVLDCKILISKFKPQLHYYVHFPTNTLGKVMNPLISPGMY